MIIDQIQVVGSKVKAAEMRFSPTCNVISGASDTGKSFLFGCLQFMFGSDKPPKEIPFAKDYERIILTIKSNGRTIRLERSLRGGDYILDNGKEEMSVDRKDVNDFFLEEIEIGKRRLRKNKSNETTSLSFSYLRPYYFIDEESIVSERSPVLSGDKMDVLRDQSLFRLLITGKDDSDLIKSDPPKILNAKKSGSSAAASAITEKLSSNLINDELNISQHLERCERRISFLLNRREDIDKKSNILISEKHQQYRTLDEINAEGIDLTGTISRFTLLHEAYSKDIERLSFVEEGNYLLGQVPASKCPTCGQDMDHVHDSDGTVDLFSDDVYEALNVEKSKIISLRKDLADTISELESAKSRLRIRRNSVKLKIESIDKIIQDSVLDASGSLREELDEVIKERDFYLEQKLIGKHLDQIESTVADLYPKKKKKKNDEAEIYFSENEGIHALEKQAEVIVKEIFKEKKSVKFDLTKWDIVIDGQARGSFGKGLRSIYRTIFYAALMNLCKAEGLPHAGFLVIDSPLTTHEESDDIPVDEGIQAGFWTYFSRVNDAQIIILENKEPDLEIQKNVKYRRFNGVLGDHGCGFIPSEVKE